MADYLWTVALASLFIGVMEYLCYPSKTKDAARLFAAFVLIHSLLSPILLFASTLSDGIPQFEFEDPSDHPLDGTYERVAREAFQEGICKLLYTKYGIDTQDAAISVDGFRVDEMKARRIVIVLSGKATLADHRGIEEYIDGLGLGDCEVRIRIG